MLPCENVICMKLLSVPNSTYPASITPCVLERFHHSCFVFNVIGLNISHPKAIVDNVWKTSINDGDKSMQWHWKWLWISVEGISTLWLFHRNWHTQLSCTNSNSKHYQPSFYCTWNSGGQIQIRDHNHPFASLQICPYNLIHFLQAAWCDRSVRQYFLRYKRFAV